MKWSITFLADVGAGVAPQVVRSGSKFDSKAVSPVVRQTLLHWGYELTEDDYKHGAKRVKT